VEHIASLRIDPARAQIFEQGWQSWSPSTTYCVDETPYRSSAADVHVMNYRADHFPGTDAFYGEGLLAIDTGVGEHHVFAAPFGADVIASLRAEVREDVVLVEANGPVDHSVFKTDESLDTTLRSWATLWAGDRGRIPEHVPTAWCTWYHYFRDVTAHDVRENLSAMDDLNLDFEFVQIDDGYQAEIGDWLEWSPRFGDPAAVVSDIRSSGRGAGIWVAPFIVGANSRVAQRHPEWLVPGVTAGRNWEQDLGVLDVTHPDAAAYLTEVFATLHEIGADYFKIDFIYAGALEGKRHEQMPGVAAYRRGLELIRNAIGDSFLLGCGAPQLASVGLVDAMRVGPDVGLGYAAEFGDRSRPSQESARMTSAARKWADKVWWVNDPDCLIVRPAVERREEWSEFVENYGGLFTAGDRLLALDPWGLEATRCILAARRATG
jgi:alpha-galactosidase